MAEGSQKLAIGDKEDDEEKGHGSSNIETTNNPNSSDEVDEESYDSEGNFSGNSMVFQSMVLILQQVHYSILFTVFLLNFNDFYYH